MAHTVRGDIKAAFHAIILNESDRDVCRFLLKGPNGALRHMRFTVLPFGLNCSPYILNSVIAHHLNKFPSSHTIHELTKNLYVDDFWSGCDQPDTGIQIYEEATSVLAEGGFHLTKWVTSDPSLGDKINVTPKDMCSILGLNLNLEHDTFIFTQLDFSQLSIEYTKRVLLSLIARIFYPLGMLGPFTMFAKILIQKLWRLGYTWDDPVNHELIMQIQTWIDSSKYINNFVLKRVYFPDIPWSTIRRLEIIAFSDASIHAFGAVVYMPAFRSNGSYDTSFVASKSRVSPLQRLTLPRLELLGCVISSRLVSSIISDLELNSNSIEINCSYYTDSTVALSWIKSDPFTLQLFVSNRVTLIQSLSDPISWFHTPGSENPSDVLSRGCLMDKLLINKSWLNGPSSDEVVNNNNNDLTIESLNADTIDIINSERVTHCLVSVTNNFELNFNFCKFSNYDTLLRVMCYMLRFAYNCKHPFAKMDGPFTLLEFQLAEMRLIYIEQRHVYMNEICKLSQNKSIFDSPLNRLNPFLDGNGILRISTGKLENNTSLSFESKYPMIIPSGHLAELILRYEHIFLKHSSALHMINTINSKFWIIGGKSIANRVVRMCSRCNRFDNKCIVQPAPYLPAFRANEAPAFTLTGLDHCGPFYCLDEGDRKYYVLLLTCAVTRSLHLEVVDSLEMNDTLLGLRRFAARRGLPSVIFSDNSTTFLSVKNHMYTIFRHHSPQWRNIPPISPWWGGWWERLVRTVKSALKKSIVSNPLNYIEMVTLFTEIEAVVNSRPLTEVSSDPRDVQALTPSHFLLGKTFNEQFPVSLDENATLSSPKDLFTAYSVRNASLKLFWDAWLHQYIRNLPPLSAATKVEKPIIVGTLVLVRDGSKNRSHWPIARIIKTYPGRDKIVRAVDILLTNGTVLKRSVDNLVRLETFEENCEVEDEDIDVNNVSNNDNLDLDISNNTHVSDENFLDSSNVKSKESLDVTHTVNQVPTDEQPSAVTESQVDNVSISVPQASSIPRTSRSGRTIKAPVKLNLVSHSYNQN